VRKLLVAALSLMACGGATAGGPDYGKRAQALDPSLRNRLVGKWTNPVDSVVVEITLVDLTSGRIQGKEWPTTGPAAGNEHELVGWVSIAPPKEGYDNVVAVSFSTTLYEYGTLPVWAGFLRDDKIITMSYLVWPARLYPWDHLSAFQQTWSRVP
jgi:Avidin family